MLNIIAIVFRINGIQLKENLGSRQILRIGFCGEFGYSLTLLLPWLLHLHKQGLKIETFAALGSSPFYYFSHKHTETNVGYSDSWGTLRAAWEFRKVGSLSRPIYVPTNRFSRRVKLANLPSFESPDLHVEHKNYVAWEPLNFPIVANTFLRVPGLDNLDYVVVNIKNYQTWGGVFVPNWYSAEDLEDILRWAKGHQYKVLLNRSPVSATDEDFVYPNEFVDAFLERNKLHVLDLAEIYSQLAPADANQLQINLLKGAKHVFATQGGNAPLALILNSHVTILMRGGSDWIDFDFLCRKYHRQLDVCYSVRQSLFLRVFLDSDVNTSS